jgi:hypothetical protein
VPHAFPPTPSVCEILDSGRFWKALQYSICLVVVADVDPIDPAERDAVCDPKDNRK